MGVNVAILGASGAVGAEFIRVLADRNFPVQVLRLLASPRSAGQIVQWSGRKITVEQVTPDSFRNIDIALFSAGKSVSLQYAPHALRAGAVVVDNSSAYRMDTGVPLVIPEVNPEDIAHHHGIIANPNCSTIILLMAVAPIHRRFPIKRIVVSTYQSASGAGMQAMLELQRQTREHLDGRPVTPSVLPHPMAFNLFCHNTDMGPNGYNVEEQKMVDESRKILHHDGLAMTATCVRVPILRAHSESINLEFHEPVSPDAVRDLLARAPGVKVVDDRARNYFPMPVDASGQDDVLVGRIRSDQSRPDGTGIDLFVSGDQLRKGAALNAVQIAEHVIRARGDVQV